MICSGKTTEIQLKGHLVICGQLLHMPKIWHRKQQNLFSQTKQKN